MLLDAWDERLSYPDLRAKVLDDYHAKYGGDPKASPAVKARKTDRVLVEAKASGQSLLQDLHLARIPAFGYNPGNADKMTRLQITASIFTTGRVWLPESSARAGYVKDWAEGFLSQLCSFPDSTHDDYVDSATQAIRLLKDMGFLDINPEPRYDDEDDYYDTQPARVNPYAV